MLRSQPSDIHLRRRIKLFMVLTLISGVLFVMGLVNNGNGAVDRYNRLIAEDQAGGDIEAALGELRSYIHTHMNSEIGSPNGIYPPIQLSGTYQRLVEAEEARVQASNDNLYSEAQNYCERTGSQEFSGSNRLDCINAYIEENGAKPQHIDESLYKYNFVAPRWSADLAGFSLVAFLAFTFLGLLHFFMYIHTKHLVHYGS